MSLRLAIATLAPLLTACVGVEPPPPGTCWPGTEPGTVECVFEDCSFEDGEMTCPDICDGGWLWLEVSP